MHSHERLLVFMPPSPMGGTADIMFWGRPSVRACVRPSCCFHDMPFIGAFFPNFSISGIFGRWRTD